VSPPPRFGMADHDEMTGCAAWEPRPLLTRPEAEHVAAQLDGAMVALTQAAQRFLDGLAASMGAWARAYATAQQARNAPHAGPPMFADARRNRRVR
jgi:hypothetical protein